MHFFFAEIEVEKRYADLTTIDQLASWLPSSRSSARNTNQWLPDEPTGLLPTREIGVWLRPKLQIKVL